MLLEPMIEVVVRCLLVEFVRLFVSQQSVVAVSPLGKFSLVTQFDKFEALDLPAIKRHDFIL